MRHRTATSYIRRDIARVKRERNGEEDRGNEAVKVLDEGTVGQSRYKRTTSLEL